jgi:3-phenylpropionate/cinnamic acid dioxygenase small subunit
MLGKAGWAYDTGNYDWLAGIFTEDALFTLSIEGMGQVGNFETRETIHGLFVGAAAEQEDQRRHVVSNIFFEDETDTSVTAVSFLTLISIQDGAANVISTGVYTDKLVLEGDAWMIKHRDLQLDLPY